MVLPTPGGPTISTFAFSSTNRSVASSSTSERSRPGCASKSKSSRRLMTGKWAKRRRPASLRRSAEATSTPSRSSANAEDLLGVEVASAERRKLAGRLRFAHFPVIKRLEDFDFDAQPGLDRSLVEELATLRFVEEKANVLMVGPPGVGKTMLALILGYRAVEAGYRVYYTTAADLVARCHKAAVEGRWSTTM